MMVDCNKKEEGEQEQGGDAPLFLITRLWARSWMAKTRVKFAIEKTAKFVMQKESALGLWNM